MPVSIPVFSKIAEGVQSPSCEVPIHDPFFLYDSPVYQNIYVLVKPGLAHSAL